MIRKMQLGGNVHYSRTLTPENLSKAANYVGEYVLKGLGTLGKFLTAPFVGGPQGTSSVPYHPRTVLQANRDLELRLTQELQIGRASTWISPLNYGAALVTGNGLNARKGEEEVASWSPAWLATARLGELYAGPKVIKGIKTAPKNIRNGIVAHKLKKSIDNTKNLSQLLATNLFQELTSAPTSTITRLRPEFNLAMQDNNYIFGRLIWSTNLTRDGHTTPSTRHIKVMDTKQADPLIYVTQALYPLAIENGGLRATLRGLARPIWLSPNKPYFGTPTGTSNSTNYTYIIDANKFTPEMNLLRGIGGTRYTYPGTELLPIEGTKRILWDPVLLLYTSTIFTKASDAFPNQVTGGIDTKIVNGGTHPFLYKKKQGGKMLIYLKDGNKIHIKKKNRGKFTAYCGGNVTSACIAKAKASGNPTLVKRATFAANARKWKHLEGGTFKGYPSKAAYDVRLEEVAGFKKGGKLWLIPRN